MAFGRICKLFFLNHLCIQLKSHFMYSLKIVFLSSVWCLAWQHWMLNVPVDWASWQFLIICGRPLWLWWWASSWSSSSTRVELPRRRTRRTAGSPSWALLMRYWTLSGKPVLLCICVSTLKNNNNHIMVFSIKSYDKVEETSLRSLFFLAFIWVKLPLPNQVLETSIHHISLLYLLNMLR